MTKTITVKLPNSPAMRLVLEYLAAQSYEEAKYWHGHGQRESAYLQFQAQVEASLSKTDSK